MQKKTNPHRELLSPPENGVEEEEDLIKERKLGGNKVLLAHSMSELVALLMMI